MLRSEKTHTHVLPICVSNLSAYTLELLNKGSDLLEDCLLLGFELRSQWTHFG